MQKQASTTSMSTEPPQASANGIRIQPSLSNHIQIYNVAGDTKEPAPTIIVKITSSATMRKVKVLPDSGRHICSRAGNLERSWTAHRQPATIIHQSQSSEWFVYDTHRKIGGHHSIGGKEVYG